MLEHSPYSWLMASWPNVHTALVYSNHLALPTPWLAPLIVYVQTASLPPPLLRMVRSSPTHTWTPANPTAQSSPPALGLGWRLAPLVGLS